MTTMAETACAIGPMSLVGVTAMGERLRASMRGPRSMVPELDPRGDPGHAARGGHLLIEDHPRRGKDHARSGRSRLSVGGRLHARPSSRSDLLPADIVGANDVATRGRRRTSSSSPGPVFANIVLVDEINRATPKTQAALLESMEERQVTVDGVTARPSPRPFMVIATQNPTAGHDGTYALPPASHDRFLARVSLGYPSRSAEMRLLGDEPRPAETVATPEALLSAQAGRRCPCTLSEHLLRYVVDLLSYTREHERIAVGASPRAGVRLLERGARGGRPWWDETTSFLTTSRRWPRPCSPTGCRPPGRMRTRGRRSSRRHCARFRPQ